jgi:hypothetical protein
LYFEGQKNVNEKLVAVSLPLSSQRMDVREMQQREGSFPIFIFVSISWLNFERFHFCRELFTNVRSSEKACHPPRFVTKHWERISM